MEILRALSCRSIWESPLSKRVGLAEEFATRFVVGRGAADRTAYVNLTAMSAKLVDPTADNRLALPDDADFSEDGGSQTGVNSVTLDRAILAAVAASLKGQTWDGETESWK